MGRWLTVRSVSDLCRVGGVPSILRFLLALPYWSQCPWRWVFSGVFAGWQVVLWSHRPLARHVHVLQEGRLAPVERGFWFRCCGNALELWALRLSCLLCWKGGVTERPGRSVDVASALGWDSAVSSEGDMYGVMSILPLSSLILLEN